MTLCKEPLRRVLHLYTRQRADAAGWFNGGPKFAECETLTLGKESLCRVLPLSTRQRGRLCRVSTLSTRQRAALPRVVSLSSVRVWALGKDILCRVPDIKYSAKFLALGKACDSGSAGHASFCEGAGAVFAKMLQCFRLYLIC